MSKVILKGYIVVPDEYLILVKAELQKHIELTHKEEGCLVFRVSQDSKNKNIFHVYEEFLDRNAFDAHQQRVKNSNWGKITIDVERHYEISEDN